MNSQTDIKSKKKSSALYFNNIAELSATIQKELDENERVKKEKILQEQMDLFLQAVIKDVDNEEED